MAVYNPIENDGRVKRISESVSQVSDLILLCPKGLKESGSFNFKVVRIRLFHRLGKVIRLLLFWFVIIKYAIKFRPTIVYVHDFYLPFAGWLASKISGALFVYDAHELIVPYEGVYMPQCPKLFYRLEKLVVRKADLVIAANSERAEVMKDHYGLNDLPTVVRNIPPMPTQRFKNEEIFDLYPQLMKIDKSHFHIIYMGDISLERGLKILIDSIEFLPENLRLFFLGAGPDLDILKQIASTRLDNRLNVLGPVPHTKVHDVIRQADIGYLSYSMNGLNNILCAPNKVFEYSQAGLPIVSTCQPTVKKMFAKYPIGTLIGCGEVAVSPEMVAEAISEVAKDKESYKSNIAPFLNVFSWETEEVALVNSIQDLAK